MADYLTDEERVEWLRSWWSRNGVAIIVGIVVAVAGVIGWRWYQDYRQDQAEAASREYSGYLTARALGDGSENAADLANSREGTAYHVFALLHEAKDAADSEDWERAAALLSAGVDYAREDVLRDLAAVRLAKVQRQLGELDEALGILAGVLSPGFATEVAELTGDILAQKGDIAGARAAYESAFEPGSITDADNFLLRQKLATLATDTPDEAESLPSPTE